MEIAQLLQYDPPYKWRGGALELIQSREPEVILSGPAETGKTYAACYKAHMACREYPGAQGALVRKVAASIPGTVLRTMKRVIGRFPIDYYGGDDNPERIIYPNGSQIWVGGMDNPTKVLSGERDFIQVCQAEELNLNDLEIMATRTTGRGAVMPYTQIFGDCNPGGSKHPLRTRSRLKLLISRHKDNPSLYDDAGNLTEQGVKSMAALQSLTGIRRKRLLEGIWASAEGAVYDMFDSTPGGPHVKVRDPREFVQFGLSIDAGYTHPAVILLIGIDGDGRWHIMREFYERGKLQGVVVAQAREWYLNAWTPPGTDAEGKPFIPRACNMIAYDEAAAALGADLRDAGMPAKGAKGKVFGGITAIQDRLKVQDDDLARLSVDPSCVNTINEFESYVWKPEKDEPVKENDHAMDTIRYFDDAFGSYPDPSKVVDWA